MAGRGKFDNELSSNIDTCHGLAVSLRRGSHLVIAKSQLARTAAVSRGRVSAKSSSGLDSLSQSLLEMPTVTTGYANDANPTARTTHWQAWRHVCIRQYLSIHSSKTGLTALTDYCMAIAGSGKKREACTLGSQYRGSATAKNREKLSEALRKQPRSPTR